MQRRQREDRLLAHSRVPLRREVDAEARELHRVDIDQRQDDLRDRHAGVHDLSHEAEERLDRRGVRDQDGATRLARRSALLREGAEGVALDHLDQVAVVEPQGLFFDRAARRRRELRDVLPWNAERALSNDKGHEKAKELLAELK